MLRRTILVAAALAAGLALLGASPARAAGRVTLSGHVPPRLGRAARLGRAPSDEPVTLSLAVSIDTVALEALLADIRAGRARHLTPDEFAAKFGLDEKRAQVAAFAQANGLTVEPGQHPSSQLVRVSGPASSVEGAFGVRFYHYRGEDGQTFRSHETDPTVPASVAPDLSAVHGLSDRRSVMKPHLRLPSGVTPAFSGSGPGNGLSPSDIKSIYGTSGLAQTGSGQAIGIIEFDGYNPVDLAAYGTQFGFTMPTINFVSIDGQGNLCGANQNQTCNSTTFSSDQGGMAEVALDIELAAALAPGISQARIYTAPNTNQGLLDAYQTMATENTAKVISVSWGCDESCSTVSIINSEATIFAQMAAQGQTVFAAAGDLGAFDRGGTSVLAVDDPASQPYVTGVGGTGLSGTVGSHSEFTWNDGVVSGNQQATGGGVSQVWTLPSFQSGVSGEASSSQRNVPDVALNADPNNSPYAICVGASSGCQAVLVGGTSAAAPLWAAFMTLVNQARIANGGSTVGWFNPTLYQIGTGGSFTSNFNDITSGNNGFYGAASGYDNATGWGSFKGSTLLSTLSSPPGTVSNVAGSALGTSSIQWSWTAASGATSYNVYYATNSGVLAGTVSASPFTQTGLQANEARAVIIKASGIAGTGSGVLSPTASTLANAVSGNPNVSITPTTLTASYTTCPTSPTSSSCEGYRLEVSVNSNFSAPVFSSATAANQQSSLQVSGLTSNTGYWVRLGTLNSTGDVNYTSLGQFSTSLVAPSAGTISNVGASSMFVTWGQSTNQSGLTYRVDASAASDFSGTLSTQQGVNLFSATFSSLSPNTSYYFRVQALPGGPYLFEGPQATLPSAPGASVSGTFSAVDAADISFSWSANGNGSGSSYLAQLSPASDFSSSVVSSTTLNTTATFGSLAANTTYYARVAVVGRQGSVSSYLPLGSTSTLALVPAVTGFSQVTTTGFTGVFSANGNAAGTVYSAVISPSSSLSPVAASSSTANTSASFSGLSPNTQYYLGAAAYNRSGALTSYSAVLSTYTLPAPPAAVSPVGSNQTTTALRASWSGSGNGAGTFYASQLSAMPDFAVIQTSTTRNTWADFTGLTPNASYYLRVKAVSLSSNPDSAFAGAGSASTLANAPTAAGTTFLYVGQSSATVQWTPVAGGHAEGYTAQASTSSGFGGTLYAGTVTGGSSSVGSVTGLAAGTTYYFRVGSLNYDGVGNFVSLGSAVTLPSLASSGTVTGSGLTLIGTSRVPQLAAVTLRAPPGAFPAGTNVTLDAGVETALPPATFTEGSATPLAGGVGVQLDAGGLQPSQPLVITMQFDPSQLPAGTRFSQVRVARYDPAAGAWTLQPSFASTASVSAQINHFSLFAPFIVQPATDLSQIYVFPIPWKPGSSDQQFNAAQLQVTNLPAGATVKVHAINGEKLWEGSADASGIVAWRGDNRYGRPVGSGTYLLYIQSGGRSEVRRAVIIR